MPVLDEYTAWYSRLVEQHLEGKSAKIALPSIFGDWLRRAEANRTVRMDIAQRLQEVHEEMSIAAGRFLESADDEKRNPTKEFKEFTRHYAQFVQIMRQLELDQAIESCGYDEKTGLRHPKFMADDVAREMERRARQGNPFALAVVKINNYQQSWIKDEVAHEIMVKLVADQIRDCLRSFDDAYYMGGEYFLLSLKQTDVIGSKSAVYRLNSGITNAHIKTPGEEGDISVSTVVCEPTPGDSLSELIVNMKNDLSGIDGKGTIVQFNDVSPLQRYLHSMMKK